MQGQYYLRRNLYFILFEVVEVLRLTKHSYFAAHDKESMKMVLDAAERIAATSMRPYLKETDQHPPVLVNGIIKVHPALQEYYKAFCASGLMAACFDEKFGGQQLPKTIYAAADFIVGNAHNGFEMFTSLSNGAAKLLTSFASETLIKEFALKILDGTYTATMCLTETQAGSSLSDITTAATPSQKGSYKIKGQKIFISAGDHDVTDNIIHLVLARVKGAPNGVKGISLFVVPKKINALSNDVVALAVYHKMGQRSTPAMHLEFGATDNCTGYLIGEEGKGLTYMFQMMNNARLGVGLAGTYIATAAYYASLQYAKERPQGRRPDTRNTNEPPVTIIHHPDVRRMLLLQKTIAEGSLALVLYCYSFMDKEQIATTAEKQRCTDLLELLTPVAKTYGAEMGIVAVNNGLQVLGGYGYTEDFILEQLARDVRIMSLYEGTTGIQSIALLGRQVLANKGQSLQYWKEEVMKAIEAAQHFANLQCYADWLLHKVEAIFKVSMHLIDRTTKTTKEIVLADANLYMELFGLVTIGWQWLLQATVAQQQLTNGCEAAEDQKFYRSKLQAMKFFFHYELRKTRGLIARLMDDEVITALDGDDLLM
ncbi:MAG: acyl-CoA dehydrogenase [Sphingobacteriales bacterium]|nr:MAG: acyl-CoA dehydrogenase [Sphingobacteriales bacterium]